MMASPFGDDDPSLEQISYQSNDDNDDSKDSSWRAPERKKPSKAAQARSQSGHSGSRNKKNNRQNKRMRPKSSSDEKDLDDEFEGLSEDMNSAMSDINPPSLSTRLRVRKSSSCTSSVYGSIRGKALSEPLLITLDSDSDEDYNPHPSKTTTSRIKRNIIRNFGLQSTAIPKDSESSSSEMPRSRKKKRKKKTHLIRKPGQTIQNQMAKKRRKLLKKRSKSISFSSAKQTFEQKTAKLQKKLKPRKKKLATQSRMFLRKRGAKPAGRVGKRNLSRKNSDITEPEISAENLPKPDNEITVKEEKESEVANESQTSIDPPPVVKKLGRPRKKPLPPPKPVEKPEESCDIEEDIRKIMTAPKESAETSNLKITVDAKNMKIIPEVPKSSDDLPDDEIKSDESSPKQEDMSLDEESKDIPQNNKQLESIKSDLDKIRSNTPDTLSEEQQDDAENDDICQKKENSKIKSKIRKKTKLKNLPPGVERRRGRPRLTDYAASSTVNEKTFNPLSYYNILPQVPFLQSSFCFDISPKLSKCRECRLAVNRNNRKMYNSYCRFMEYRKLCYDKKGQISGSGFSNPSDATKEDLSMWVPHSKDPPHDLNFETAKSLLEHIGDQFCDLVEQEKEALDLHIGTQQVMTWKRIVQGVREMCDVCSTTIFNIHWVCPICGFAVCIDCYKVRKQGIVIEDAEDLPKDRDEFKWLLCNSRSEHQQDSLVMAQMIPGSALWNMREFMHKARQELKIPAYCKCYPQEAVVPDKLIFSGVNKQLMSCVSKCFSSERNQFSAFEKNFLRNDISYDDLDVEVSASALKWLENIKINENNFKLSDEKSINYHEDLEIIFQENVQDVEESEFTSYSLSDIISGVTISADADKSLIKHYNHRYPQPNSGRDPLPIRIYTKIESELSFSNVPHSWFCNGRLLFLHQADHPNNLDLFQEQWKRGQPIVVKGVDESLDMSLWHPDSFCQDFGEVKNDLVDCKTGTVLKNLPMKKFWEGFENLGKRLTDDSGEYMLLKLKDWPPGEDFSEKLPSRFQDLMQGLPLPEYTHRNGVLNLAGRLPMSFVRPDLGPKMYNAYGSALFPTKGTTNLHLDISDAVNVMVYVGIPSDGNAQTHITAALKAIDEGGCDSLMRSRVRTRGTKPGALWHIYNARDTDKIRDMLTKVALERGEKLEAQHDPIHDQSWYIDAELRQRLYRDYGVEGYAIAQCLGDAVFIPAGAPHQVRNLHSCVKVAEDFVSPENIAHCFKLTQEFRHLSDTHTNHEDKLQIKNIIYHVIRDSLSHLIKSTDS